MRIDIAQLNYYHQTLRNLLTTLEKDTGLEFTITSQYRENDTGVHGQIPLRGTDLRMRVYSIGKAIESYINSNWQYDIDRPHLKCALLHGKGSNLHLHVQVHPKTVRL